MYRKELEQHIQSLPEYIRNAIEGFDWVKESTNIINKFQLQIDDIDIFKNITLMIATGILPANKYAESLIEQLDISKELAGNLVEEANQTIFTELQKRAFSKEDIDENEGQEFSNQTEISSILKEEGIEIIDPDQNIQKPNTPLQNLADSLLNKQQNRNSHENEYTEKPEHVEEIKPIQTEKPEQSINRYQEPIELQDLAGITKHRIPYVQNIAEPISETNLSKSRYTQPFIAGESSLDLSPSKQEQITENGEFLKHIGAVSK